MDALTRIEKKLDRLLARRRIKDHREPQRRAAKIHRLRKQVEQLKVEKLALLKYIRELETILKLQREGDLDI